MRCDEIYEQIVNDSKQFCIDHNLPENNFKNIRLRKRKRHADENIEDITLNSAFEKYKINTYYMALDKITTSFTSRFKGAQNILKDLSLLLPLRLLEFGRNPEEKLPENCFNYITEWIPGISIENLKNEYKVFSSRIKFPVKFDNNEQITELNNSEIVQTSDSEIDVDETESNLNNTITVTSILHVINSFDWVSAFPNIYLAYRALGTDELCQHLQHQRSEAFLR